MCGVCGRFHFSCTTYSSVMVTWIVRVRTASSHLTLLYIRCSWACVYIKWFIYNTSYSIYFIRLVFPVKQPTSAAVWLQFHRVIISYRCITYVWGVWAFSSASRETSVKSACVLAAPTRHKYLNLWIHAWGMRLHKHICTYMASPRHKYSSVCIKSLTPTPYLQLCLHARTLARLAGECMHASEEGNIFKYL